MPLPRWPRPMWRPPQEHSPRASPNFSWVDSLVTRSLSPPLPPSPLPSPALAPPPMPSPPASMAGEALRHTPWLCAQVVARCCTRATLASCERAWAR
eukprot:4573492-Alexandrium_andersonii.AAC.1